MPVYRIELRYTWPSGSSTEAYYVSTQSAEQATRSGIEHSADRIQQMRGQGTVEIGEPEQIRSVPPCDSVRRNP